MTQAEADVLYKLVDHLVSAMVPKPKDSNVAVHEAVFALKRQIKKQIDKEGAANGN